MLVTIALWPQFDSADIAQPHDLTIGPALDDDGGEFARINQPALRINDIIEIAVPCRRRRLADRRRRPLACSVPGSPEPRRSPSGRERRACSDRARRASNIRSRRASAPDAIDARNPIFDLQEGVILRDKVRRGCRPARSRLTNMIIEADCLLTETPVRRTSSGSTWQREVHPILHEHLRGIQVCPERESDRERRKIRRSRIARTYKACSRRRLSVARSARRLFPRPFAHWRPGSWPKHLPSVARFQDIATPATSSTRCRRQS